MILKNCTFLFWRESKLFRFCRSTKSFVPSQFKMFRRFRGRKSFRRSKRNVRRSRRTSRRTNKRTYQPRIFRPMLSNSLVSGHRYSESFSLNAAAGLLAHHYFRANDMYDPNGTGVGHQPMGFDEIGALFNHFTVIGSKIVITCSGATTDTKIGCYLSGANLLGSGIERAIEAGSKTITMNTNSTPKKLVHKCSPKKFFRQTSIIDNYSLRGSTSASPAEIAYYLIWVAPADRSADLASITLEVQIYFTAVWTERALEISQS